MLNRPLTVLTALAAVALMGAAPAPAANRVDYTVAPVIENGALTALEVDIRFRGDDDGETTLNLPDAWAGETEYWRHIEGLTVEGAQASDQGPAVRVLKHAPGAAIHVRYRVRSAFDKDPGVGDVGGNPYRPIIRPRWFSVLGNAMFALPNDDDQRPATFRWRDTPRDWVVASDLDHQTMGRVTATGDIIESVLIGAPDLTLVTRKAAGAEFRLAMVGHDWRFQPSELGDLLGRTIEAQRRYWKQPGESYFVAVAPMTVPDENWMSVGGTGRSDGFSLYAGVNASLEPLRYLLAHEHMHTFNSRRLGVMAEERDEPLDYWFSEGFTDFLTHRTLLRSGVWTIEDYVERLNEDLAAYATSPALNMTNAEAAAVFWTNPAAQKLPYQRGALLALIWDHQLHVATRGRRDLDEVLAWQMAERTRQGARGGKPDRIGDLFLKAWASQGGADLAPQIERHLDRGERILLPEDLFGVCARVETLTRPNFARGWDPEATTQNGNVVTDLRDDSPAYAAGLRNGMQIVKREFGVVGDASVEYGLRITENGEERVIRFMPTAPGTTTVQSVTLKADMSARERAACLKRMSGTL